MSKLLEQIRMKVIEKIEQKNKKEKGFGLYSVPDGVDFFKPQKPGIYHIDILPYRVTVNNNPQVSEGDVWFERTVYVHFGEHLAYICPRTIGKKCPICDHRFKLMKDPNADEELIKALKPKERQLFNVICLDDDEPKIKIWEVSRFLFGEFLEEEIRNGDEENASFFFYECGKTLKVRFKQENLGDNTFLKTHRIDFLDREDYGADILKETIDLDKILIVLPYEELEKKFFEFDESQDDEENENPVNDAEVVNDVEDVKNVNDAVDVKNVNDVVDVKNVNDVKNDNENVATISKFSRRKKIGNNNEIKNEIVADDELQLNDKPNIENSMKRTPLHRENLQKCLAGGEFGNDCNKFKECGDCNIWDACQDRKDELDIEKKNHR